MKDTSYESLNVRKVEKTLKYELRRCEVEFMDKDAPRSEGTKSRIAKAKTIFFAIEKNWEK